MASHPLPLPCALALLLTSHQNDTTPSPCWVPHFMTRERNIFSNPTPSEKRLSPAAMVRDDMLSAPLRPRLALCLYLAACNQSSRCRFPDLDHLSAAPICVNRVPS